ncbi:MAG: hypothetical protein R3Y09_04270 [Clostridia bacterium]
MNNNKVEIRDVRGIAIKKVYSRYAIGLMNKGKGWFKTRNIFILGTAPCAILRVFPKIGHTLTVSDATSQLETIFSNQAFAKNKARGSLGGASRWEVIEYNCINDTWKRKK